MTPSNLFASSTLAALAPFTLTPAASAQEWVGWGRSCPAEVTKYSRNLLGNVAGEVMTRIDNKEHAGWGAALPGFRVVDGIMFAVKSGPTPQSLDILFRKEATPDVPFLGAPTVMAAAVPIPVNFFGCVTLVPPTTAVTAVPIVGTGDVFLSFNLPAAPFPGWPTDGLGIGVITGYTAGPEDFWPAGAPVNFDKPGPNSWPWKTPLATGTYGLVWPGFGAAAPVDTRTHWFDLRHLTWGTSLGFKGAGGVGITWNTQVPNYFVGATGTSTFLSGSSPHVDGSGANVNLPARCDTIGMGITMNTPPLPGHLVLFVLQLGGLAGTEPWIVLNPVNAPPTSTGVFCLDLFAPLIASIGIPTLNNLEMQFTVPCGIWLSGLEITQQAFAMSTGGLIHSTPCDRMKF